MLRPLIVIPVAVLLVAGAVEMAIFDAYHDDKGSLRNYPDYKKVVNEFKGYVNDNKIEAYYDICADVEQEPNPITQEILSEFASDYCKIVNTYETFQTEKIAAARGLDKINVGIYPKSDTPLFKKLKKQGEKLASGPKIYFTPDQAAENTIKDKYYIIIMLAAISILLCGIFPYEKKNRTIKLLTSTKSGLQGTVISKLCAGCIGAALISIVFSIVQDVFIVARLNIGAIPAAFQSITMFGDSIFCLSIAKYLLLSALLRIIGSVFFGLIIMAFSCLFRHSIWVLGFGGAIIAISTFFEGILNTDITLNPFTLCSVFRPLMKFSPIVILGRAFEAATISYWLAVLISAVFLPL